MRLESLYRLRFRYDEHWSIGAQNFGIAEGRCEGRVSGRFRAANHARVREDGTVLPDIQGVIEVDGGGLLMLDLRGRARLLEDGSLRAVGTATHLSGDERFRWLDDVVCAIEARRAPDEDEIEVEVSELVWEER